MLAAARPRPRRSGGCARTAWPTSASRSSIPSTTGWRCSSRARSPTPRSTRCSRRRRSRTSSDHRQECIEAGIFAEGDPLAITFDLWAAAHGVAGMMIVKPLPAVRRPGGVRRPGAVRGGSRARRRANCSAATPRTRTSRPGSPPSAAGKTACDRRRAAAAARTAYLGPAQRHRATGPPSGARSNWTGPADERIVSDEYAPVFLDATGPRGRGGRSASGGRSSTPSNGSKSPASPPMCLCRHAFIDDHLLHAARRGCRAGRRPRRGLRQPRVPVRPRAGRAAGVRGRSRRRCRGARPRSSRAGLMCSGTPHPAASRSTSARSRCRIAYRTRDSSSAAARSSCGRASSCTCPARRSTARWPHCSSSAAPVFDCDHGSVGRRRRPRTAIAALRRLAADAGCWIGEPISFGMPPAEDDRVPRRAGLGRSPISLPRTSSPRDSRRPGGAAIRPSTPSPPPAPDPRYVTGE